MRMRMRAHASARGIIMELESGAVLQVVGNFTVFSTLAVKKLCIYFFPGASLRSLLGPERR